MNKQESTGMGTGLGRTLLAVTGIVLISASGAMAQGTLGNLVSESGFDWMLGKWQATSDEGDKVELEYKWELDKNLMTIRLKWPNFEYSGMIFYMPGKEQVIQIGVDNGGGNGKGTWEPVGEKAVLKYTHTGFYGEINRMGFAHSRVDAETMKVEVYEMYSDGSLGAEPAATTTFKRQKPQPPKKDSAKTP